VKLEIRPEPTPEERAAIEQAVVALLAADGRPRPDGRGEWWRQGLHEALEAESEPGLDRTPGL
jgi:hypothetical protein